MKLQVEFLLKMNGKVAMVQMRFSLEWKLSVKEIGENKYTNAVSIFVNENGIGILGLQNLRDKLGKFWPDWDGNHLPKYKNYMC